MFLSKLNYLFDTPDDGAGKGDLGKESIITLLGEDDDVDDKETLDLKDDKKGKGKDEKDEKDDKEGEDEDNKENDEEEEKDELDELEEELGEIDPEKLELMAPVRRKEILTKYPKLFKDFPYLEKAYYREQQFTEILSTIDDAKEAVAKSNVLDQFQTDLGKGDLEKALKVVKGSGEEAFNNLVDNYLPNLHKIDKEAYGHVIGNVLKSAIGQMNDVANETRDETIKNDLIEAAKILNKFAFGTEKVVPPSNLSKAKSDEKDPNEEANLLKAQHMQERFEESRDNVNNKISNVLKSTIEANIDPKESMTDYVRKNASRECKENVEEILGGDKRLNLILDRLWQAAAQDGFSKASVDKVKSAYLSRAKTLLPEVIKKARNEALKGLGKRVEKEDNEEGSTSKKGPLPTGRTATSRISSSGKTDREKAAAIPKGMSTRDFLAMD